jgi:hypothetical protein
MVSPIARIAKFLSGGEGSAAAEILPPGPGPVPARDGDGSAEARADTFAALFLDKTPKDLRGNRPGSR